MAVRLLSYERSSETDIILVLPGGKANRDFVRLVVEENQAGQPFRLDDLLLLNQLLLERHMAVSEAAFVIQKPIAEARSILERLTESGIIDARGEGKNRSYQFSAHTYKRLGQEAAYMRQRGLQPVQILLKINIVCFYRIPPCLQLPFGWFYMNLAPHHVPQAPV